MRRGSRSSLGAVRRKTALTLDTIFWGLDYIGETRTVDVHIGTLRTKLGKYSSLIATVRGIGYRMEDKL